MPSFDRPASPVTAPSAWVRRFAPLIPPGSRVLDVACGEGRHARWFAARGHQVTAVDVDISAVIDLGDAPTVELLSADLESGQWPYPPAHFAGIVMTNYLHRPLFPALVRSLAPGGVLLIETFAEGNQDYGRPRNPAFLLKPGELLQAFAGPLQVVAYEHGVEMQPRPAVRQRLCAVKGSGPVGLPG